MLIGALGHFATAEPLLKGYPQWVGEEDAHRIAAYQLYEQIYKNVPGTFELVSRGAEDKPIYIPAAKVIVETLHRYMGNGLAIVADPLFGTPEQRVTGMQIFTDVARRERLLSNYSANRREGIYRGDWMWHLYADPSREQGARISIFPLDPAAVFKIHNEGNVDEVIGVHIVEQIKENDGSVVIRRLTYMKQAGRGGPSPIEVTDEIYKLDEWGGPGRKQGKPIRQVAPPQTLPAPIDSLPVYHIRNRAGTGAPWGTSEIAGLERILAAIDQSISDEELTLANDGLGIWVSNREAVDDEGRPVPWNLGPGRVAVDTSADAADFIRRINASTSIQPYTDHRKYLHDQLDAAASCPNIAKGRTDVSVAASGVALRLELGPILSRGEEGELGITDTMTNLLYDYRKWHEAYEGPGLGPVRLLPMYGPKIPEDPSQIFDRVMKMVEDKMVSLKWARGYLTKRMGYEFPADDALWAEIVEETEALAQAAADAGASRFAREAEALAEATDGVPAVTGAAGR